MEDPQDELTPATAGNREDAPPPEPAVEPHKTAEDTTELLEALRQLEEVTRSGFTGLHDSFEEKLAFDRFKEGQITRLHEELQSYKSDLIGRLQQPFIRGLVRLHDDLGKTVAALTRRPSEEQTPQRFFNALDGFAEDLELLLGQHGIEGFENPGESFDPRRQTALRTEPTRDPAKVGTVAGRLRPGFEQGEKLLQKERVAVYALDAVPTATCDPEQIPEKETHRESHAS